MHEIKPILEELRQFINQGIKKIKLDEKKERLKELNVLIALPDFWNDQETAQKISQEAGNLNKMVQLWDGIDAECDELLALLPEIHPEQDPEGAEEYRQMVFDIQKRWKVLEISTFFGEKYDENNIIMSIHAGTGGTDASDFAEMLLRMYMRYAERMGFNYQILEKSVADDAGIKSVSMMIAGSFAYGYLKREAGVHRLVRLSPFNAKNSRETSFVLVEILPEISEAEHIEIKDDDLRIDVFRSGGAGGQSVNKTDSAVRMTHLPTGIVVSCQNERSQQQNRQQAMKILQGKLADLMEKERAAELSDLKGKHVEMSWGNQIRSYVLHPYKMVKDHRTGYEEHNPDRVLDGEIEGFIEAEIKGQ